jgi:hypothetical protein
MHTLDDTHQPRGPAGGRLSLGKGPSFSSPSAPPLPTRRVDTSRRLHATTVQYSVLHTPHASGHPHRVTTDHRSAGHRFSFSLVFLHPDLCLLHLHVLPKPQLLLLAVLVPSRRASWLTLLLAFSKLGRPHKPLLRHTTRRVLPSTQTSRCHPPRQSPRACQEPQRSARRP